MSRSPKPVRRPEKGRGVFLTRDSNDRSEMAPGGYVNWAAKKAKELGVSFTGTAAQIDRMIHDKCYAEGDIFQDQNISGNILSRPGLDACLREIAQDPNVSHLFIPRSDRLARPDEIMQGVELEQRVRQELGVTLVYMDRTLPPIPRGQKLPLEELLVSAIQHDQAAKFRRDLAVKVLTAQRALAERGLSTGGRAKYGLRRCLVTTDGTFVRALDDRERVRTKGQHVIWMPDEGPRWETRKRIVSLLSTHTAGAIARLLIDEGIPSPDAGRSRTDAGVKHVVSGLWQAGVITAIGRDPLNVALHEHGRRSMGDCFRYSAAGPRPLDDRDFGESSGQRKVIVNPTSERIRTTVAIERVSTDEAFAELQRVLDDRAGTQRGKPRSRHPEENPLGARIFDMHCCWPMYRCTKHGRFTYACGLYTQSRGSCCRSNHIDGKTAVRLVLSYLRQHVLYPDLLPRLEQRVRQLVAREFANPAVAEVLPRLKSELREMEAEIKTVGRNMARATTDEQRQAMADVFDELSQRRKAIVERIAEAEKSAAMTVDPEKEVAAAMQETRRLTELAAGNLDGTRELFRTLNARLFLRFADVYHGKRVLRTTAGGMITFGNEPPPIKIYDGPTDRESVRTGQSKPGATVASGKHEVSCTGSEGHSVGNVSRGTPRYSIGTPIESSNRGAIRFPLPLTQGRGS